MKFLNFIFDFFTKRKLDMKTAPKKFEIQVFEADYTNVPDGMPPKWRPAMYQQNMTLIVSSKRELDEMQQDYARCDQKFKIIRELPISEKEIAEYKANNNIKDDSGSETPSAAVQEDVPEIPEKKEPAAVPEKTEPPPEREKPMHQCCGGDGCGHDGPVHNTEDEKSKPKFYRIGGIDIKNDNGVIYQKQWMRISDEEANNFRIVNDKNNMVVNLVGKHIEARRWVLVEDSGIDVQG